MLQADHHQKGFFSVAALTSVGWGISSLFPLVNTGRPLSLPSLPALHLAVSGAALTLLLFSLWVMNRMLYQRLQRAELTVKTRKVLRYALRFGASTGMYYAFLFLVYLMLQTDRPVFPSLPGGRSIQVTDAGGFFCVQLWLL
jgi:hypothetical protein